MTLAGLRMWVCFIGALAALVTVFTSALFVATRGRGVRWFDLRGNRR